MAGEDHLGVGEMLAEGYSGAMVEQEQQQEQELEAAPAVAVAEEQGVVAEEVSHSGFKNHQ